MSTPRLTNIHTYAYTLLYKYRNTRGHRTCLLWERPWPMRWNLGGFSPLPGKHLAGEQMKRWTASREWKSYQLNVQSGALIPARAGIWLQTITWELHGGNRCNLAQSRICVFSTFLCLKKKNKTLWHSAHHSDIMHLACISKRLHVKDFSEQFYFFEY